jgi:hypothetical protein
MVANQSVPTARHVIQIVIMHQFGELEDQRKSKAHFQMHLHSEPADFWQGKVKGMSLKHSRMESNICCRHLYRWVMAILVQARERTSSRQRLRQARYI